MKQNWDIGKNILFYWEYIHWNLAVNYNSNKKLLICFTAIFKKTHK